MRLAGYTRCMAAGVGATPRPVATLCSLQAHFLRCARSCCPVELGSIQDECAWAGLAGANWMRRATNLRYDHQWHWGDAAIHRIYVQWYGSTLQRQLGFRQVCDVCFCAFASFAWLQNGAGPRHARLRSASVRAPAHELLCKFASSCLLTHVIFASSHCSPHTHTTNTRQGMRSAHPPLHTLVAAATHQTTRHDFVTPASQEDQLSGLWMPGAYCLDCTPCTYPCQRGLGESIAQCNARISKRCTHARPGQGRQLFRSTQALVTVHELVASHMRLLRIMDKQHFSLVIYSTCLHSWLTPAAQ